MKSLASILGSWSTWFTDHTVFDCFKHYASVKGPINRGFSYIEIWMTGVQTTLLMAIIEYGAILAVKKYHKPQNSSKTVQVASINSGNIKPNRLENNWDIDEMCKKIDIFTFFCSLTFIVIFNAVYWIIL